MQIHTEQLVEIGPSEEKKRAAREQNESGFEPLLDVAEASKLLRIHPKILRTKARLGIIPAVRASALTSSQVEESFVSANLSVEPH